jgi:hypothetical protein
MVGLNSYVEDCFAYTAQISERIYSIGFSNRPSKTWVCRIHDRFVSNSVPTIDDQFEPEFCVFRGYAKLFANLFPQPTGENKRTASAILSGC